MKKKYYMIGISCILLLIAGVCYSCSFKADKSDGTLIHDLSGNQQQTAVDPMSASLSKSDSNTMSWGTDTTLTGVKDQSMNNPLQSVYDQSDTSNSSTSTDSSDQTQKDLIYVHLCGAVQKPGVYQVSVGDRVVDAIDLAGGLKEEAAGDYINQAQQVQDGQRIYIPSLEEVKELPVEAYSSGNQAEEIQDASAKQLLNINTADEKELMELPGIGEAKAADIIDYRKTNGSFSNIEELMKIPGIKEGLFHKVSSLITVK